MFKKLLSVAALGMVTTTILLAVGCASQPYSATGSQSNARDARYQDSKGHYHPEWVSEAR